jgi:hypothetical protein
VIRLDKRINSVLAGIYLRVLRVLRFHFPGLLPARRVDFLVSADVHQDVEAPGSARRRRSEGKENGTAKHAEHANDGGCLQVQDDASDLKALLESPHSAVMPPSTNSSAPVT